jgi:hypothetical protein
LEEVNIMDWEEAGSIVWNAGVAIAGASITVFVLGVACKVTWKLFWMGVGVVS